MRYGPIPTSMLERVALAAGKVPVPMLDAVFGPMKTSVGALRNEGWCGRLHDRPQLMRKSLGGANPAAGDS